MNEHDVDPRLHRALFVFVGRGGLGLALAAASIVALAGLTLASRPAIETGPLVIGVAVVSAVMLLVVVSRQRAQRAAERIAEAAIDHQH